MKHKINNKTKLMASMTIILLMITAHALMINAPARALFLWGVMQQRNKGLKRLYTE